MGIKTVDRGCLNQSWTTELAEVWLQLTKLGKFSHARIILRGFYNEQPTWWCRIFIFFCILAPDDFGPRITFICWMGWNHQTTWPWFWRMDSHTNTLIGIEQDVKPQIGCTGSWRKRQMTSPKKEMLGAEASKMPLTVRFEFCYRL